MAFLSEVETRAVRTNTTTTLVGFSVATGRVVLPEFVNKPQTEATHAIMPHTSTRNHAASALAINSISTITNGSYAINHRAGIDVDAILAILDGNTVHHQRAFPASDAVSSIVVVAGVIGSMSGLTYLDAVASVAVAVMVAKIGWELGWHSVHELIDKGLEPEDVENIHVKIMEVDGVLAMHQLRTRRMGGNAFVDVHVLVSPSISVSEGHRIGQEVLSRLRDEVEEIVDVTVHIDPEDDETHAPCGHLPMRGAILERLRAHWRDMPGTEHVQDVTLHYLNGQVRVEVRVPLEAMEDMEAANRFSQAMAEMAYKDKFVTEVKVVYS